MVPKSTAGFHPIMKECACATRMRQPQRQPTATTRPPWRRPRASKPARPIPPRNPQVAVKLLYASPQPRRLARGGAATARALGRDTSNFSSEIGAPTVFAGHPPHTLVPGSLAPPGAGTQILLPHAPAANRACLLRLPPRLSACACPKVCSTCADVFFDPVVSEEGITYCRRCVPVAASNRTGEARPPPARAQRPAALVLSPAPRLRGPNRASAASAAPSPPPPPPLSPPRVRPQVENLAGPDVGVWAAILDLHVLCRHGLVSQHTAHRLPGSASRWTVASKRCQTTARAPGPGVPPGGRESHESWGA